MHVRPKGTDYFFLPGQDGEYKTHLPVGKYVLIDVKDSRGKKYRLHPDTERTFQIEPREFVYFNIQIYPPAIYSDPAFRPTFRTFPD